MEKCLPENMKEKIRFKRTIPEVWKFLGNAFVKQDIVLYELMHPVLTPRAVPERD